jgi:hypothetical protein
MSKNTKRYHYCRLGVGGGIDLRRTTGRKPFYEFRPAFVPDPRTMLEVTANVELEMQGGAWVPVPEHLLDQAKAAFADQKESI